MTRRKYFSSAIFKHAQTSKLTLLYFIPTSTLHLTLAPPTSIVDEARRFVSLARVEVGVVLSSRVTLMPKDIRRAARTAFPIPAATLPDFRSLPDPFHRKTSAPFVFFANLRTHRPCYATNHAS